MKKPSFKETAAASLAIIRRGDKLQLCLMAVEAEFKRQLERRRTKKGRDSLIDHASEVELASPGTIDAKLQLSDKATEAIHNAVNTSAETAPLIWRVNEFLEACSFGLDDLSPEKQEAARLLASQWIKEAGKEVVHDLAKEKDARKAHRAGLSGQGR